jgi:hypothetical protein
MKAGGWTTWGIESFWPYVDSKSDPSVVHPIASSYSYYATVILATEETETSEGGGGTDSKVIP